MLTVIGDPEATAPARGVRTTRRTTPPEAPMPTQAGAVHVLSDWASVTECGLDATSMRVVGTWPGQMDPALRCPVCDVLAALDGPWESIA